MFYDLSMDSASLDPEELVPEGGSSWSSGLSSCHSESLMARRKRLEIRRFKMSMNSKRRILEPARQGMTSITCNDAPDADRNASDIEEYQSQTKTIILQANQNNIEQERAIGSSSKREAREQGIPIDINTQANGQVASSPGVKNLLVSNGSCPSHGLVSIIGRRREMEEAAVAFPHFVKLICNQLTESCGSFKEAAFHYYGFFDGHGGIQAAVYCKERLHRLLAEEMLLDMQNKCQEEAFVEWSKVIASTFLRLDAEFRDPSSEGPYIKEQVGKHRCCRGAYATEKIGAATMVLTILCPHEIVVASCGNSRVVLCTAGKSVPLSRDYEHETRGMKAPQFPPSSSIGFQNSYQVLRVFAESEDDSYSISCVFGDPKLVTINRSQDDECLILASKGLWDTLSTDFVCEVARKCLAGGRFGRLPRYSEDGSEETATTAAAAILTKLALARGSTDNISVIVVDLKGKIEL